MHAAAQVVHLDTTGPSRATPPAFLRAWNARLPGRRPGALPPPAPDFHARRPLPHPPLPYRQRPPSAPLPHRYAHHVRDPLSLPGWPHADLLLGEHDLGLHFPPERSPGPPRHVWRVDVREGGKPGGIWHTLGQWVAQPPATLWAPLPVRRIPSAS